MKLSPFLFAASLAANLALAAAWFVRQGTPPAPAAAVRLAPAKGSPSGAGLEALRLALASGDLASLQAQGLSPDLARTILVGRALARYTAALRASRGGTDEAHWWRSGRDPGHPDRAQRDELAQARRELSATLVAAWGIDPITGNGGATNLSFLAPEKQEALRRVLADYEDLMDQYGARDGVQLTSDREQLKLLRAERDRDIAALLTPNERADYELRTSASAASVRARYGDAIESEDDLRKLVALQKAFDERFPPLTGAVTPDMVASRAAGSRQLQDDMRATLGEEKYAALRQAADPDYRTLEALAARLNLPSGTSSAVLAARDNFALESQQINADPALLAADRRTQLQALANQAKSDLGRALGNEGAKAYAQRTPWVTLLQSGMAFATTPPAGGSGGFTVGGAASGIYPVMPAGRSPGEGRQVIISNTSSLEGGAVMSHEPVMSYSATTISSDSSSRPPPSPPAPAK